MDTWYVTDLDGTLLDPDGRLRQTTVDLLRPLIGRGLKLTVATARTPATALKLLAPLRLTGPAVLMSGALLYDLGQKKPLAVSSFSPAARAALIDFLDEAGRDAFLYCAGDSLTAWHRPLTGSYAQSFRAGRSGTPYKRFVSVEHYHQIPPDPALLALFCLPGPDRPLLTGLQAIPDAQCVCYADEYGRGVTAEVFPAGCDKGSGVEALRRLAGGCRVVAFGDNVNDLPLFAAADECYAVGNALAAVKEAADGVIGPNTEDGVARWLAAREGGL